MPRRIRRVVSGLNPANRSTAIFDDTDTNQVGLPNVPGFGGTLVWMSDGAPADNHGNADAASGPFVFPPRPQGSCFYIFEYPPLSDFNLADAEQRRRALAMGHSEEEGRDSKRPHPGMHKTPTLDYIVMISGEITVLFEDGEVTLEPGDVFVDRGVYHAWENRGAVPAVFASIVIDAQPV